MRASLPVLALASLEIKSVSSFHSGLSKHALNAGSPSERNRNEGFSIRNDYSKVATKLQDILYYSFNISQIIGRQRSTLIKSFINDEELIDRSSYDNTINGDQSIHTYKTISSKISNNNNNIIIKRNKINTLKTINNKDNESNQELNKNSYNKDTISLKQKLIFIRY